MELAEKINHFVSWALKSSVLIVILIAIAKQDWPSLFISALAFFLMFLPSILARQIYINLPVEFEFFAVLYVYASVFLGDVHGYYTKFPWWDVVLHTSSGLMLGLAGFIIMFSLYEGRKVDAKPITLVTFAFCFSLAIGAVWEIFEFAMDQSFGTNLQQSGLVDTMWDLIVDSLGSLVTCVFGFIYLRHGKAYLFESAMNHFIEKNPKMFRRHPIAKKARARLV